MASLEFGNSQYSEHLRSVLRAAPFSFFEGSGTIGVGDEAMMIKLLKHECPPQHLLLETFLFIVPLCTYPVTRAYLFAPLSICGDFQVRPAVDLHWKLQHMCLTDRCFPAKQEATAIQL